MPSSSIRWGFYIVLFMSLAGLMLRVTARTASLVAEVTLVPPATNTLQVIVAAAPPASATATRTAPPSQTAVPATATATFTPSPLPAATLTAIYEEACRLYDQVPAELLTLVDRSTALPRNYEPETLSIVPLEARNTAYRPVALREIVHRPLLDMLDAMNQAGLSVWVISGFRSYTEQQLAFEKWQKLYPDRATDISAVPGHSEHQLGTAVDFSTPYMDELYSDFFHIHFAQTPEGQWLTRQAAYYGFTLSYPAWATEQTGYAWEPWHFRYVGILAQELYARNITLTHYLQQCIPQ